MKNFIIFTKKLCCLGICVLLTASLFGCTEQNITNTTQTTVSDASYSTPNENIEDALEKKVNIENALTIDFDNEIIPKTGVNKKDNTYSILKGGTYIIRGNLSGQLVVNADKQDVWLILDNAHINCDNSSPLYIADAKDTYLILRTGSENSLIDGNTYTNAPEEDPDATLFCKNDLIIGGGGTLDISSNYNNALHTKDTLTICSGTINIDSVDTGIKAKDGLTINAGILNITSTGDGLQTTNSEDSALGNIEISGANIVIKSEKDAIQSENALKISGGSFDLTTGNGAENADFSYNSQMMPPHHNQTNDNNSVSMKGIKAKGTLSISGGSFNINSEDDALHSNAEVTISSGDFTLASGDDGIHADKDLGVSGGNISVTQSYEGLEGANVNISGGTIHIKSSDDGINSAGGGDTVYGGFGPDSFSNASNYSININGGYTYIHADSDGLDSNGSIIITGGTAIINGSQNGGNAPLDWETDSIVNGGILIACGSAEMMESLSSDSEQCSLGINFETSIESGTLCNISAENSDFSLTFCPDINSSYLLISTPELQRGETYTVSIGGNHTGKNTDGLYQNGSYTGGEVFDHITQESIVTLYGSTFGGMGGMHGGMGSNPMGGNPMGGRW